MPRCKGLTPRQNNVLRLYSAGYTHAEIAKQLGLRRRTVLRHVSAARARLGATNDAHLLRLALTRRPDPLSVSLSAVRWAVLRLSS
ncbi:MAG: response regulator transcription factor [Dehalococcoidia bacterium]